MSTEIYRRYIDIINENSLTEEELNENMLSKVTSLAQKAASKLPSLLGDKLESVKQAALKATGGSTEISMDNIQKVAKVLKNMGIDKMLGGEEEAPAAVNEGILGALGMASVAVAGGAIGLVSLPLAILAGAILFQIGMSK